MKKDRSKQLEPTEKQKRSVRDTMRNWEKPHIAPAKAMNMGEISEQLEARIKELRYEKTREELDTQVGGDHYIKHTIQPWDIIDEYDLGYYGGNALKYLLRDKGDRKEDLEKARHYIAKMIGDLVNANNR